MLEQIIEKFEFMNSLIDILNPLELYEFLNHQKMLEVVDSDIRISENDLRSDPTLNISDEKIGTTKTYKIIIGISSFK